MRRIAFRRQYETRGQAEASEELAAAARAAAADGDFSGYVDDFVGFCRDVLGVRIWHRQREIADALRSPKKRVAVRSGQKTGKTLVLAAIALWWLCTRPTANVVVSAYTIEQLKKQLWFEIRTLYETKSRDRTALSKTPRPLQELLGGHHISVNPKEGLSLPDGRKLYGIPTDDKLSAAGHSGAELLQIADEASEIDAEVMAALEGNTQGGGWLLIAGNPTSSGGPYFDAFHTKSASWVCIHIDARETPNYSGREAPIPGLAARDAIDKRIADLGIDNPIVQVRVCGNFAANSSNSICSLALVDAARRRWLSGTQDDPAALHIGVDVARFGDDDSAIAPVRGRVAYPVTTVHGFDTVQVSGKVIEVARTMRCGNETVRVKVDVIGVGGGVADILLAAAADPEMDLGWLEVIDVNVAESADEEGEYSNLRSQLWFGLADWMTTAALAPDDVLEDELRAPTYGFDLRGRRKVESKDEIKKRLRRSPDRADALGLAVYGRGQQRLHVGDRGSDDYRLGSGRGY